MNIFIDLLSNLTDGSHLITSYIFVSWDKYTSQSCLLAVDKNDTVEWSMNETYIEQEKLQCYCGVHEMYLTLCSTSRRVRELISLDPILPTDYISDMKSLRYCNTCYRTWRCAWVRDKGIHGFIRGEFDYRDKRLTFIAQLDRQEKAALLGIVRVKPRQYVLNSIMPYFNVDFRRRHGSDLRTLSSIPVFDYHLYKLGRRMTARFLLKSIESATNIKAQRLLFRTPDGFPVAEEEELDIFFHYPFDFPGLLTAMRVDMAVIPLLVLELEHFSYQSDRSSFGGAVQPAI